MKSEQARAWKIVSGRAAVRYTIDIDLEND
jgi:hypothetical protein